MPKLTKGWVRHRLYVDSHRIFPQLCAQAGNGQVIVLVGPTQSAKSRLLDVVDAQLRSLFVSEVPGAITIVKLTIETVADGRTKPKWLGIELLKVLEHPTYKHLGCLDELEHYSPSRGRDEGMVRTALKEGFNGRNTQRVLLDEGHLLTRSKDPHVRAGVMESIKTSCAINRTLIIVGGYELAYNGLFDSSHFCGRLTIWDYGSYSVDDPDDHEEWLRISKTVGEKINLKPKDLLVKKWKYTLERSNGTYGLFEKWLWNCKVLADALGTPITWDLLKQCEPPALEVREIARDIKRGREALAKLPGVVKRPGAELGKPSDIEKKAEANKQKGNTRVPFERNPNRNAMEVVELLDED